MISGTDDHSWGLWQKWQDDIMEAILAAEAAGAGCGRRIGPFPCCSVVQGDCLELMKQLPDGCVDAVMVTDPPYGINYCSNWEGVLPRSIHGDSSTFYRDETISIWGKRAALVFGTWKVPFPSAIRQMLIWDTQGALGMGALDLPWKPSHQQIYVLGKGFSGYRDNDVLSFHPTQSTALRGRLHPHEKPIELLIELVSKCPFGLILDPFCGSGTTLVAAKKLGRHFLGFEISEQYCEIARRRLAEIDAQPSLFDPKPQQEEMF